MCFDLDKSKETRTLRIGNFILPGLAISIITHFMNIVSEARDFLFLRIWQNIVTFGKGQFINRPLLSSSPNSYPWDGKGKSPSILEIFSQKKFWKPSATVFCVIENYLIILFARNKFCNYLICYWKVHSGREESRDYLFPFEKFLSDHNAPFLSNNRIQWNIKELINK